MEALYGLEFDPDHLAQHLVPLEGRSARLDGREEEIVVVHLYHVFRTQARTNACSGSTCLGGGVEYVHLVSH